VIRNDRYISRLNYKHYCEETCPAVDTVFDELASNLDELIRLTFRQQAMTLIDAAKASIKDVGTGRLRDGLHQAVTDLSDAEDEREVLEERVNRLEAENIDLKARAAA
jgi:hypothetical protein